ncbi:MAG TPA: succinate-semialdehyde dehydrogenase (NADP(+)), partial [Paraburkholderia sp.]
MSLALTRNDLIRPLNLIDGQWIAASNGARFAVTNPATGETIVEVANSSAA